MADIWDVSIKVETQEEEQEGSNELDYKKLYEEQKENEERQQAQLLRLQAENNRYRAKTARAEMQKMQPVEDDTPRKNKRIRGANWSPEERTTLLRLCSKREQDIRSKECDGVTINKKKEAWAYIYRGFISAHGISADRSMKRLKQQYWRLKAAEKDKYPGIAGMVESGSPSTDHSQEMTMPMETLPLGEFSMPISSYYSNSSDEGGMESDSKALVPDVSATTTQELAGSSRRSTELVLPTSSVSTSMPQHSILLAPPLTPTSEQLTSLVTSLLPPVSSPDACEMPANQESEDDRGSSRWVHSNHVAALEKKMLEQKKECKAALLEQDKEYKLKMLELEMEYKQKKWQHKLQVSDLMMKMEREKHEHKMRVLQAMRDFMMKI